MTTNEADFLVRPAIEADCAELTELALSSKAFWGYSDAFIRSCRSVLTVTPPMIDMWPNAVLEAKGEIAGFHFLSVQESLAELELLYITPHCIGKGYGEKLFRDAISSAIRHGCEDMRIEADPNALGFYKRMGAKQIGWCRSEVKDDRELPLMMLSLRNR